MHVRTVHVYYSDPPEGESGEVPLDDPMITDEDRDGYPYQDDPMDTTDDDSNDYLPQAASSSSAPRQARTAKRKVVVESGLSDEEPITVPPLKKTKGKGKARATNDDEPVQEDQPSEIFSESTQPAIDPLPKDLVVKLMNVKTKFRTQKRLDHIYNQIKESIPANLHHAHVKTAIKWHESAQRGALKSMNADLKEGGFDTTKLKHEECIEKFLCSSWYGYLYSKNSGPFPPTRSSFPASTPIKIATC